MEKTITEILTNPKARTKKAISDSLDINHGGGVPWA
jgi:hypothetical protein